VQVPTPFAPKLGVLHVGIEETLELLARIEELLLEAAARPAPRAGLHVLVLHAVVQGGQRLELLS
jgi:hypothetical protein